MKEKLSDVRTLKIHAEFGGDNFDVEGTPETVFSAFIDFFNKVYPEYEVLQDVVFTPDLIAIMKELKGVIQIAPEGIILLNPSDMSSEDAICVTLTGLHVSNKLNKSSKEALSANELSKITGKALKTIFNQLAWMVSDGIVERAERGEYKITSTGIIKTQELLKKVRELT
jgi:hypothetical protein